MKCKWKHSKALAVFSTGEIQLGHDRRDSAADTEYILTVTAESRVVCHCTTASNSRFLSLQQNNKN